MRKGIPLNIMPFMLNFGVWICWHHLSHFSSYQKQHRKPSCRSRFEPGAAQSSSPVALIKLALFLTIFSRASQMVSDCSIRQV
ncbi:hypothetical protein SUGI_0921440 [Cryptomeria japonica]|nr:hypothetical protein SUGI_0921440 [Cryptomeria japonica]